MKNKNIALLMLAACGTAASVASAQPYSVNVFGATLLQNIMSSVQLGNDYIDVDQDGIHTRNAIANPDSQFVNLPNDPGPGAPYSVPGTATNGRIVLSYRAVGSINGLEVLAYWGGRGDGTVLTIGGTNVVFNDYATATPASNPQNTFINQLAAPTSINGEFMAGALAGFSNTLVWAQTPANPGFLPFRTSTDGNYLVQPWLGSAVPGNGGVQTDIAPIDVDSIWGVAQPGTINPLALPATAGYGSNPRLAYDSTGLNFPAGQTGSNSLVTLPFGLKIYGSGPSIDQPAEADDRTIFDTQIAWAPIVPLVNYGVGLSQITYTDVQHLTLTGRRENGENLHLVTREIGSGTHNAFMNSFGVDPSWGLGENIGPIGNGTGSGPTGSNAGRSGANFIPGNKLGTSQVRDAMRLGSRLTIGYVGGDSWDTNARLANDVLAVGNNLGGRTPDFVRPTTGNILDNGLRGQANLGLGGGTNANDGWRVGGKAVVSTIGNPLLAPAPRGGYGWPQYVTSIGETTVLPNDVNPGFPPSAAMTNVEAAAIVNNLKRSIDAFNGTGGVPETDFTPGQFVATRLIAIGAADYLPQTDGVNFPVNPDFQQFIQENTRALGSLVYNSLSANFASFGAGPRGLNGTNPTRLTLSGSTYSDGNTVDFRSQGGATLSANAPTLTRNRIVGDFNGDGLRNINDAMGMIAAWNQRNGGAMWMAPNGTGAIAGAPGTDASIELLGDFNADGNFGRANGAFPSGTADTLDVRYWADGLAIDATTGKLDRKAGFTAVDTAFAGNFFGTTKALGSYNAGDARGDVFGPSSRTTRGYRPIGGDGTINAFDVDYVSAQINAGSGRSINWATEVSEAAVADLSADMNGDLIIDCTDVTEIVTVILGTQITDLNLDGVTDAADLALAATDVASGAVWSQGDVNCDGAVNQADRDIIGGGGNPTCGDIDINNDGGLFDPTDIDAFLSVFSEGPCVPDTAICDDIDFNNDGGLFDPCDIDSFLLVFAEGPCTICGQ